MIHQRYTVDSFHRVHQVARSGTGYKDYGPRGMDFLWLRLEQREKGKRKWVPNMRDMYSAMVEKGRIVYINRFPFKSLEESQLAEGSDKWVAIAAEIARFYADTTPKEN